MCKAASPLVYGGSFLGSFISRYESFSANWFGVTMGSVLWRDGSAVLRREQASPGGPWVSGYKQKVGDVKQRKATKVSLLIKGSIYEKNINLRLTSRERRRKCIVTRRKCLVSEYKHVNKWRGWWWGELTSAIMSRPVSGSWHETRFIMIAVRNQTKRMGHDIREINAGNGERQRLNSQNTGE